MDNIDKLNNEELTDEYISMFFNNLCKHLDNDSFNKVKDKFYQTFRWYLKGRSCDSKLFGYGLLNYLLFLNDHNLLDTYKLDDLEELMPYDVYLPVLDLHCMIYYPKLFHDINIDNYYTDMYFLLEILDGEINTTHNKLIILHNYYKDLIAYTIQHDYISLFICYLYQNDKYNIDDYDSIFKDIKNNYDDFVEQLNIKGIDKNKQNMEYVFDSYINNKLNNKKYIK